MTSTAPEKSSTLPAETTILEEQTADTVAVTIGENGLTHHHAIADGGKEANFNSLSKSQHVDHCSQKVDVALEFLNNRIGYSTRSGSSEQISKVI